jgi:hypothetical protein
VGNSTVTVSGMSTEKWNPSFNITDMIFGNLGIELALSKNGTQRSSAITLLSDATLRGVDVRARVGLTSDGSGSGGSLLELVAREDGKLLSLDNMVKALPLLPSNYAVINLADYVNVGAKGILLATEAGTGRVSLAAEDVKGKINGQEFSGQLAIAGLSSTQPVMFISNDKPWTPARIFPSAIPKGPFADLALPESLIILSPAKLDAKASDLHPRIYDKVFAKLYGARDAAKVIVNDGLTVVARVNLTKSLPAAMQSIMAPITGWLPISGDMLVGAGVDASSGGLGFYADVNGLTLPIPAPFNTFVSSAGGRVQLFFKTAGATAAGVEAGLEADVKLGIPRLDTPTTIQKVDAAISLSVKAPGGAAPEFSVAAKVPGAWPAPAGLEGFSLTDTSVAFGGNAGGTTVNIATEKASFRQSDGSVVSFLLDLNTAWAGGAPTQLSVQFAKSPDVNQLVMTPALQAELTNSVMQLAFKGGSSLFSSITSKLGNAGLDSVSKTALQGIGSLVNTASGGMMTLIRNSPMAMVGVRNPVIFFATPGNELPEREGVDRPPFGLGLQIKGTLILNVASKSFDMADGDFKINLRDGFYVRGKVKPPAPFSDSTFTVSGNMPLIATQGAGLTLSGKLELPGLNMLNLPANISGSFNFRKPAGLNTDLDVSSSISIAGLASRDAYFTIRGDNMKIYSAAGPCIDVPIKLDGNVGLDSLTNPTSLLTVVQPSVPDPVECAKQLGKVLTQAAQEVGKAAVVVSKALEQGGKAAFDAARQGADSARQVGQQTINGAVNLANSFAAAVGGGDKKTCNARIEALRKSGNVLSKSTAQGMVDRIYMPAIEAAGKARFVSGQYANYGLYPPAMQAYEAMVSRWNASAAGQYAMPGLASYHNPGQGVSTSGFNAISVRAGLNDQATLLNNGTGDTPHLAGWAQVFAEGWDDGRRPESQALWHRCAADWNANVPTRTARAWNVRSIDYAVWMTTADYFDLIYRLEQHVLQERRKIDNQAQFWADYTDNWTRRSSAFQNDLILKMHLSMGKQVSQAIQDYRGNPVPDSNLTPFVDAYDATIAAMVRQLASTLERSAIPKPFEAETTVFNVQLAAYRLKKQLLPLLQAKSRSESTPVPSIDLAVIRPGAPPAPRAAPQPQLPKPPISELDLEISNLLQLTEPTPPQPPAAAPAPRSSNQNAVDNINKNADKLRNLLKRLKK